VVLTMLSAYYFDPRLIWDRQQQQLSDDPDSDDNQKQ
jgi:paraquat-inducible protein A